MGMKQATEIDGGHCKNPLPTRTETETVKIADIYIHVHVNSFIHSKK